MHLARCAWPAAMVGCFAQPERGSRIAMKRLPTILLLACCLSIPALAESPAEKPALALVADAWCPVSCADDGRHPGYAVEITREIFSAAGFEPSYRTVPWARAVADTRDDRFQILIGVAPDESREALLYPEEPVALNINVFFVRADNSWRYGGLQTLDNMVVGVANDYIFGEPFDSYNRQYARDTSRIHVLVSEDPVTQGLALLRMKRIDSYLDDEVVVRWSSGNGKLPADLRAAGEISRFPLYIAFPRKNPQAAHWAQIYDKGIRRLRANGRLKAILERYGVEDWKR